MLLLFVARWAVHNTTWFAPAVADGLRFVIGADAVESIERLVAGTRDRAKRALPQERDTSTGYVELDATPTTTPAAEVRPNPPATPPRFHPKDVGPMDLRVAAPEDGLWRELLAPAVFTTLLHPDPTRSWSRLWVFAMDLQQLELHPMAGTVEPKVARLDAAGVRTGLIPEVDQGRTLLAFNGGFKAEHGRHGMRTGGVTLLPPRDHLCTLAGYSIGRLRIGTWSALSQLPEQPSWFRQTPPCMVEAGLLHRGLLVEKNRDWGATLEGEVVIPRSAVGLDAEGRTLYFSLSHDATPRIMADGMRHIGATHVAQLDVNWPYPRLLVFRRVGSENPFAASPIEHIPFDPADYLRKASKRDFFYVTWRSDPGD